MATKGVELSHLIDLSIVGARLRPAQHGDGCGTLGISTAGQLPPDHQHQHMMDPSEVSSTSPLPLVSRTTYASNLLTTK